MITIGVPKINRNNKKARLTVDVEINGETKQLWLEVDEKYEKFLVKDRCDAFVIALLPVAMKNKKELVCLSPVSEELLHNLRTHLIPTLAKSGKSFYRTRISADIKKDPVKNIGAVGTGMSGGVDSMHVLGEYLDTEYPTMKLTHLCLNDTGAFDIASYNEGGRSGEVIKEEVIKKYSKLAKELDLPLIITQSNLAKDFGIQYATNHIYCNLFPVFAMQKLFKLYYYGSSGYDFTEFTLSESDRYDCGHYELLLGYALSTSSLKIFIEGGEKTRFEKIEDIIHFSPAQKYLNVCMTGSENCNVCRKCMSTILALDSLNRLDYFSNVFDTNYYKHNKQIYTSYLNKCHSAKDIINEPTYQKFKNRKMTDSSNPEVFSDEVKLPENINTSSILIKSMKTRKILVQKQINELYSSVVFSKIMTAILAIESNKLQATINLFMEEIPGVKAATLYDLINVLLITQNNVVADIIAECVSGSAENFVALMNKKAEQLGMKNTQYSSTTGLGNNSRITAEDAYILLEYALQNKIFCQIFGRRSYRIVNTTGEKLISTTNQLIKENSEYNVPECLGAKYGACGNLGNIVAVTQKADDLYIGIFLGIKGSDKYIDAKNLLRSVLDLK